MFRRLTLLFVFAFLCSPPTSAEAVLVAGGGGQAVDCMVVFDSPSANHPPAPKAPRHVRCVDGDPTCDNDGERNGVCEFSLGVCANSSSFTKCTPQRADSAVVAHAEDDGNPKFDPDFQALQLRVDTVIPSIDPDECTSLTTITVNLRGPDSKNEMKSSRKIVRVEAEGRASGRIVKDKDRTKLQCLPEGDGVYLPTELYSGTFDRIRTQVFAQSCALSSCHDSESRTGNLSLLSGAAYSAIVDVTPSNPSAAGAGLLRIDGTGGDPNNSFLYRKLTGDLLTDWGARMPYRKRKLSDELTELVRLWIIGDGTLGAAPQAGWVTGTDQ